MSTYITHRDEKGKPLFSFAQYCLKERRVKMVILAENGEQLSEEEVQSLDVLYSKRPHLLEGALKLASSKKKVFKPEGVLYARQKVTVIYILITSKLPYLRNSW